jgi:uncharacterized protein
LEKYALFLLLSLLAEIVGTVSGFGSSILFVPLASMFFDFKLVLGITALFHVFSNISKIFLFREGVNKQIALKLGIPAVLSVAIGAWLTVFIPQQQLQLGMNIALLLLAVILLINTSKKIEKTNRNLYIGGLISGFLAGITGSGGAIRGLTLLAFDLPMQVFIATSALIDLGVDTTRAVIYVYQGYVHKDFLILLPFLLVVSLLGSWLGKLILQKTSQQTFKYMALLVIIGTAGIQLYQYFFK